MTSEQFLRKTRLDFIKLFGVTTYLEQSTTVLGKYGYVEDGTTHTVLHLNNATYPGVEATPKDLTTTQWNELLATATGDSVTVRVEKRGDKRIMTYFENINLP